MAPHLQGPSLRILDFGGGDGAIASAFAKQLLLLKAPDVSQVDITVVDPSEAVPQPSQDAISMQKCRTIDEVSGRFQLVIASASLEHIQRPVNELRKLTALLDPGGIFYARTPYASKN